MELRHLRYFVAVAEELHFGRAAARLHIAQPPLSQQIRRLETELGVALFERNRRRVTLTEPGRLLLAQARPLLAEADRVEALMRRSAAGDVGHLRIGFVGSSMFGPLPRIVRAFRDAAPDVELALEELATDPLVQAIVDRRVDVGLVRLPADDPALAITPILSDEFVAALPDSHALARGEAVAVADLRHEPFVSVTRHVAAGFHDDVVEICRQAGFSPRVAQEARDIPTVITLVAAGIGVALVPGAVAMFATPGITFRPLSGPNLVTELAVARRTDDPSPLPARFCAIASKTLSVSQNV